MAKRGENLPGQRRPAPRELQKPERDRQLTPLGEAISEYMNALVVISGLVLASVAPEGTKRDTAGPVPSVAMPEKPASPDRGAESMPPADRKLIAELTVTSLRLRESVSGAGNGPIARLRRTDTKLKEKCHIAGAIAKEHMSDIVEIAAFLQSSSTEIPDPSLRIAVEQAMRSANISIRDPEALKAATKHRIEGSAGYAAIQSCGFFVLNIFGGKLASGIDKNVGHAEPVVSAIIEGVKKGIPQARKAGEALLHMSEKLL